MAQSSTGFLEARRVIVWVMRLLSYLVYAYVVVVEVILGLGFFLLLFGANPTSDFVQWIYRSLNRAMEPFRGIFKPVDLGGNQEVASVFDASVLFAMIVYGLLAILVHAFIRWLTYRLYKLDREMEKLEQEDHLERAQQALDVQGGTAQPAATGYEPPDGGSPTG
jgi:hypothetical protein